MQTRCSELTGIEFDRLSSLLQPIGGLFSNAAHYRAQSDEPRLITTVVSAGDVGQVWKHIPKKSGPRKLHGHIEGSGVGLSEDDSLRVAIAEALERYCTAVYSDEQLIFASAQELAAEALDLDTIPCCSEAELSNPRCPLAAPSKQETIRWVRGISLVDGRIVYLPAVMVYIYAGFHSNGERIWLPITTGCAAHWSFESALVRAILEVIERDAVSLVWLQKLDLPRIDVDSVGPVLKPYWDLYLKSSRDLDYVFFDATTDLSVPTVYGLQISPNPRLTTLVSCSAALNAEEAIAKVIRDMAACRIALRNGQSIPEKFDDFTGILHGASYMAQAQRAHAFDFLLNSGRTRSLSQLGSIEVGNDKHVLRILLDRFRRKGMDVFAVDLSTDEALRCGMRVVRVLIPSLHPLSFHYLARYLGHRRLYQAPRDMGYTVHEEGELNPWPQPFA